MANDNSRGNLSSPTSSPTYIPGAVSSVKSKATIGDYKGRLAKNYQGPPIKKKAPVVMPNKGGTVAAGVGKEYQALMEQYKGNLAKQREAAMNLYNQNRSALDQERNTTRNSLTGQRGSDLTDITENYAARGIGRSSGVVSQAGADYDTSLSARLKNIDDSYNKQAESEDKNKAASLSAADTEYATQSAEATADAAKRKSAAIDATKKAAPTKAPAKTLPSTSPIVKNKTAPKITNGR